MTALQNKSGAREFFNTLRREEEAEELERSRGFFDELDPVDPQQQRLDANLEEVARFRPSRGGELDKMRRSLGSFLAEGMAANVTAQAEAGIAREERLTAEPPRPIEIQQQINDVAVTLTDEDIADFRSSFPEATKGMSVEEARQSAAQHRAFPGGVISEPPTPTVGADIVRGLKGAAGLALGMFPATAAIPDPGGFPGQTLADRLLAEPRPERFAGKATEFVGGLVPYALAFLTPGGVAIWPMIFGSASQVADQKLRETGSQEAALAAGIIAALTSVGAIKVAAKLSPAAAEGIGRFMLGGNTREATGAIAKFLGIPATFGLAAEVDLIGQEMSDAVLGLETWGEAWETIRRETPQTVGLGAAGGFIIAGPHFARATYRSVRGARMIRRTQEILDTGRNPVTNEPLTEPQRTWIQDRLDLYRGWAAEHGLADITRAAEPEVIRGPLAVRAPERPAEPPVAETPTEPGLRRAIAPAERPAAAAPPVAEPKGRAGTETPSARPLQVPVRPVIQRGKPLPTTEPVPKGIEKPHEQIVPVAEPEGRAGAGKVQVGSRARAVQAREDVPARPPVAAPVVQPPVSAKPVPEVAQKPHEEIVAEPTAQPSEALPPELLSPTEYIQQAGETKVKALDLATGKLVEVDVAAGNVTDTLRGERKTKSTLQKLIDCLKAT